MTKDQSVLTLKYKDQIIFVKEMNEPFELEDLVLAVDNAGDHERCVQPWRKSDIISRELPPTPIRPPKVITDARVTGAALHPDGRITLEFTGIQFKVEEDEDGGLPSNSTPFSRYGPNSKHQRHMRR